MKAVAKEGSASPDLTTADNWGDRGGDSAGVMNWGRTTIIPLLFVPIFTTLTCVLAFLFAECKGSFEKFLEFARQPAGFELAPLFEMVHFEDSTGVVTSGVTMAYNLTARLWQHSAAQVTPTDIYVVMGFAVFQLILMRVVPGSIWTGPITSSGHTPTYKANGMQCHVLTLALFLGGYHYLSWFDITYLYFRFVPILMVCSVLGNAITLFCMIKGLYFPSTGDSGHCKSWALNYYWGTELYPRVFGWDVKQFCNCRFGMMSWSLLCLSHAAAQHKMYDHISNTMLVSVALQVIYCSKFFYWETGYFNSIDIHMDRAGFYLLWGCTTWVPILYTSASNVLASNPIDLPDWQAYSLFAFGCCSIYVNWWADEQRKMFRKTGGKEKIWGRIPEKIEATYMSSDGTKHNSLLLCSGFWGLARHFHYLPELLGALAWSVPVLGASPLQFCYVTFLFVLLLDRSFRDDVRCATKYGKYWGLYQEKVPYRIIPYVF